MIPKLLPSLTFRPKRLNPPGLNNWVGHLPFAADLIAAVRPKTIVELGTHYGESYFGLCQATLEASVPARCYAVDTWAGDDHAGFYAQDVFDEVAAYNTAHYSSTSRLIRSTFDEALKEFENNSVCLLHIDGLHTYDAVSRDFANWYPKVRPGGAILLHDIAARHADFGVWRLWEEIAGCYPSLSFAHSWGLGVIAKPQPAGWLAQMVCSDEEEKSRFARYYQICGERLLAEISEKERTIAALYARGLQGSLDPLGKPVYVEVGVWAQAEFSWCGLGGSYRIVLAPANGPALIEIREVLLQRSGSDTWETVNLQTCTIRGTAQRLPNPSCLAVINIGPDPQIEFAPAPGPEPCSLKIDMRIRRDFAQAVPELADWMNAFLASDKLRLALDRSDEQRRAAIERVSELEHAAHNADVELARLRHTLDEVSQSREALLNSWSWRLTAPMRAAAKPFFMEKNA
jgi:hypothetical protein